MKFKKKIHWILGENTKLPVHLTKFEIFKCVLKGSLLRQNTHKVENSMQEFTTL